MSKHRDEPAAEETLAETLDPKTYMLVRLNAAHQGHDVLPAEEGWQINTAAQKRRPS